MKTRNERRKPERRRTDSLLSSLLSFKIFISPWLHASSTRTYACCNYTSTSADLHRSLPGVNYAGNADRETTVNAWIIRRICARHIHTHTHTHTHTRARARARTHARTHAHACMHARTHTDFSELRGSIFTRFSLRVCRILLVNWSISSAGYAWYRDVDREYGQACVIWIGFICVNAQCPRLRDRWSIHDGDISICPYDTYVSR